MNQIHIEKLINRIRYILALFFFISGLSAMKNGSAASVYNFIMLGAFVQLSVALLNQYFIHKKRYSLVLIYFSVTIEVMNLLMAKIAFHGDPFNGWGLTIKEQSTFIMFIMYVAIHALRFNKWLNVYMGVITISGYISLVILGLTLGNIQFVNSPELIFTPYSLRAPTEVAKILFMAANAYFMYLMGDFTTRFIKTIQEEKRKADENLQATTSLLTNVNDLSTRLSTSMSEMSATTMSLADNTQKQTVMENDIVDASTKSVTSIEELSKNTDRQTGSFNTLKEKVTVLSHSIEELSSETTKAIDLTESITRSISDGTDALRNTNEVMVSIEKTSNEMTAIMELINDISDQINLLSLNAAIESARAGESGRGFAVVADEISKLADRTAQSINDIDVLIKNSNTEVKKGIQSIKYTNQLISQIINDTSMISDLIRRISDYMNTQQSYNHSVVNEAEIMKEISDKIEKSLAEHRETTKNISEAIVKIGSVGYENSSAAEEMAASTEEIASIAETLQRMVDGFEFKR